MATWYYDKDGKGEIFEDDKCPEGWSDTPNKKDAPKQKAAPKKKAK